MKLTQLALACALTGALAACGGGGGSDTVAPATRTLDGVAAKGLIKNGLVKVYAYNADGTKAASPIATTRTSSTDGSYSVSLGSNIGLFTVEVSADADTKMADEFSGDIAMPVGMTIRSLLQLDSASSTAVKGYVTPFTEMLVNAAAKAAGGLTAANAAAAQTGVTTMLGFNPLTTKPLMVNGAAAATASDAEKLQSVTLAALSKLANDANNNLGCAGSVSEKIDCVVKATTSSALLKDGKLNITLAAQTALRAASEAVVANKELNKTELTTLDGKTTFTQAEAPTSSTALAPIAAAKALFASLRSNIKAWSDASQQGGALRNSAEALKADFDTAIAPLDKDLADWILLSERGVNFFNRFVAGGTTANQAPVFIGNRQVGNCQVYADTAANTTLASAPSDAKSVLCSLNKTPVAGTEAPVAGVSGQFTRKQFTKTVILVPVAGSNPSFSYESRARMETVQYAKDPTTGVNSGFSILSKETVGSYDPATKRANGTISYTLNGNAMTGAAIKGFMPARTDDLGVAITDQEAWDISYVRTPEADGIVKYALSGAITALKGGATVSSVALKDGSYLRAVPANGEIVEQGLKDVNLALAIVSKNSQVAGTLTLGKFSTDKSGSDYKPTDLKFVGSVTNASAEFFNGTWTAKLSNYTEYDKTQRESATNFIKGSASFVGITRIPNRPDLKLSLSASTAAFKTGEFSVQYEDGTNTILFSYSDTKPHIVNVSSAEGISVQFDDRIETVDVMKNSNKIATYNRNTGLINYTDGSVESLK